MQHLEILQIYLRSWFCIFSLLHVGYIICTVHEHCFGIHIQSAFWQSVHMGLAYATEQQATGECIQQHKDTVVWATFRIKYYIMYLRNYVKHRKAYMHILYADWQTATDVVWAIWSWWLSVCQNGMATSSFICSINFNIPSVYKYIVNMLLLIRIRMIRQITVINTS